MFLYLMGINALKKKLYSYFINKYSYLKINLSSEKGVTCLCMYYVDNNLFKRTFMIISFSVINY